jgi:hypothetical protein
MQANHVLSNIESLFDSNLNTLLKKDILEDVRMGVEVDGMCRTSSWIYTIGLALAGMHVEDSYLHSINANIWLRFDVSRLSNMDKRLLRIACTWNCRVRYCFCMYCLCVYHGTK